jgi:DNA-binding HxlR family transcriptional regulator
MTRTDKKVRYPLKSKLQAADQTVTERAAHHVEAAFVTLAGRWKLLIIFHLFSADTMRFSALERAIPAVSQKMLIQHLRQLEIDGIVARKAYPQVPPKVEYSLTAWGNGLCGPIEALTEWAAKKPKVH